MKTKYRILALMGALALLLGLAACGSADSAAESSAVSAVSEAAEAEPSSPEETVSEPASEPAAAAPSDAEETGEPEAAEEQPEEPVPAFTTEDASAFAGSVDNQTIDPAVYLDYSAGIEAGVYTWILSDDGSYYTLAAVDESGEAETSEEAAINVGANNQEASPFPWFGGSVYDGVYLNANITNVENQTMLIYVPAAYLETDGDGNVTGIDHEAAVGDYTADTAPVVYANECGGWRSSTPRSCDSAYIAEGMIYVTAGARSRDAYGEDGTATGKAPTQMVDLKAGVIQLRANSDVIPGDKDKIISVGTSGGGQMSSILGASGNMPAYYEYMYESGVLGVTKSEDGTYQSAYADNVYGAQCYCPIADIENADLAYAWWWVDLADKGGTVGTFTDFDFRLQELEADAFVEYINGLGLKDADGNALTLDGLRAGSYYEAVLGNISDALNAAAEAGEADPASDYPGADWLTRNEDGTWSVTDLAGFMVGTGLVNARNKAVPGFDTMSKSAENDAFGTEEDWTVHYSASVAQILSDHYEELSALDGFNAEYVDSYIEDALTGDKAAYIANQTNLLNATEIMLGADGYSAVDPAPYWRDRSGTADQHTSFTIGYNLCLAAQALGLDADYHLVWNMGHGSNEGTSTGTFIDWIHAICG